MNTHTRKPWLLLAALGAAGGAQAKPKLGSTTVSSAKPPSPIELARRATKAYDHLPFPLSATISILSKVGGAKPVVKRDNSYVRANDRRHWSRVGARGNSWFVSGTTRVMCSSKTGKCTSPPTNVWELESLFDDTITSTMDLLRESLSDPRAASKLSSSTVRRSRMNGEPVHVLTLNRGRKYVITIGDVDGIIRQIEVVWPPPTPPSLVIGIRIAREKRPFPASTFTRPFKGRPGPVLPASTVPPTPSGPPM